MTRRIYDFKCSQGHLTERLVDLAEEPTVMCNTCSGPATRVISPARIDLEGLTGDFPGAADKWVKQRKEKIAQERKERQRNGEPS